MQPGTLAASSSNPAISQVPLAIPASSLDAGGGTSCQPRVYSSRVASPPSPRNRRLARRTFDREFANPTQVAAIPIDEIEVEDLGLAVERACVPRRAAVEPPRHLLPQRHLSVPQRQEQIAHALFGGEKCRETRGRRPRCTGPSAPGASARFQAVRRVLRRRRCRRSPHPHRATATSGNRTSWAPTPAPCRRRSRTAPADACGPAARLPRRPDLPARTPARHRRLRRRCLRRSTTIRRRVHRTGGCAP